MHLRGAVLLVGLLTGTSIPLAVPASLADPVAGTAARDTVAVATRLAPPVVTVGEPSVMVVDVRPGQADRPVLLQRRKGDRWKTIGTTSTDATGHAEIALPTGRARKTNVRAVAPAYLGEPRAKSRRRLLTVVANTACSPTVAPVDPDANGEATCLLTRFDRWRRAGLMGVGQQLNVSSLDSLTPLTELDGLRVSVVGFDLEELAMSGRYDFPFLEANIDQLLTLADQGAVLVASWHALNPHTGGGYTDRSWHDLAALLDPATPEAQAFWADYDQKLALLGRLQTGDGGRHARAAVVFRPLHEANGDFFWWGKPNAKAYRQVWKRMQQRAAGIGLHNVVWAYSANRHTSGVQDPSRLVPRKVDIGGLDTYDPELGEANADDRLWLEGYDAVRAATTRQALTEVGPHGSIDGSWDPAVVTRTVRKQAIKPAWAMLWFDDGDGQDGVTGRKQIGSLTGGQDWLADCANGLCVID